MGKTIRLLQQLQRRSQQQPLWKLQRLLLGMSQIQPQLQQRLQALLPQQSQQQQNQLQHQFSLQPIQLQQRPRLELLLI